MLATSKRRRSSSTTTATLSSTSTSWFMAALICGLVFMSAGIQTLAAPADSVDDANATTANVNSYSDLSTTTALANEAATVTDPSLVPVPSANNVDVPATKAMMMNAELQNNSMATTSFTTDNSNSSTHTDDAADISNIHINTANSGDSSNIIIHNMDRPEMDVEAKAIETTTLNNASSMTPYETTTPAAISATTTMDLASPSSSSSSSASPPSSPSAASSSTELPLTITTTVSTKMESNNGKSIFCLYILFGTLLFLKRNNRFVFHSSILLLFPFPLNG